MVKTITLDSLDRVMDIFKDQQLNEKEDRYRSSFIYRGMPDSSFKLQTSLKTNCGDKSNHLEQHILRNFAKYAALGSSDIHTSIWDELIIGQHHGLPTRLLDWTYSPLIALHFSTSEGDLNNMSRHDSCLWRIDAKEINALLPDRYHDTLKTNHAFCFTDKMLAKCAGSLEQYDADMGENSMVIMEPSSLDERIISQYSFFSVIPGGFGDIEKWLDTHTNNSVKYIVKANIRWQVRDMLDAMNINERILFPGLDGLSEWIKRYYYVK